MWLQHQPELLGDKKIYSVDICFLGSLISLSNVMIELLQTQFPYSQKGQKTLCFLYRAPTKQEIQSVHLPL